MRCLPTAGQQAEVQFEIRLERKCYAKKFSGSPGGAGNISGADKSGMGKMVFISPLVMIL